MFLENEKDDAVLNLSGEQSSTVKLRDWQRRAKQFFFDSNGQAIFEVTTGAGKTMIAIDIIQELIEKHPSMKVLIVVPKNVILETSWYKEIIDYGIPIQNVGVFYGNIKEVSQITITNMQSINKLPLEMFDCLCLDELHNYATPRMMRYLETGFTYKLGLTATLKRMDNRHKDLLRLFNYNKFTYQPAEALHDNILNPFVFYNIGVQLDVNTREMYDDITQDLNSVLKAGGGYKKLINSNSPLKLKMLSLINHRKHIVNNYDEKFDVVRNIILKNKDKKIIVFNQYNDQTSKIYWKLLDDDLQCRVIHSGISDKKREQDLIDFRNDKFNILLTSKVLDEGYNLPKLDVAIIMAGDSTDKQTIQRMGRVLRKKKDGVKSKLFQIYCMQTIEESASEERSKTFKRLSSDYRDIVYYSEESLKHIE